MKYLIDELRTQCFYGSTYDQNEDKFLIGYLNKEGDRLKDIITGQIIEGNYFARLSDLRADVLTGGGMALGYITGLRANSASMRQRMLAKYIDAILRGDVVDERQIAKIKDILNRELQATHKKELKLKELENKREAELKSFAIEETERDF